MRTRSGMGFFSSETKYCERSRKPLPRGNRNRLIAKDR
jgi:hypothetical protein